MEGKIITIFVMHSVFFIKSNFYVINERRTRDTIPIDKQF